MIKIFIIVVLVWTSHGKQLHQETYYSYPTVSVVESHLVCDVRAPVIAAKVATTAKFKGRPPTTVDWSCGVVF